MVIIRGGGAVNDMAWLNDYALVRCVCELDIPVLTGIGNERDRTVLDEVANQRFDTLSKVIAGIERTIVQRTREAQSMFEQVSVQARRTLDRARQSVEQTHVAIQSGAHQSLADTRAKTTAMLGEVKLSAAYAIRSASDTIQRAMADVRHMAHRQIAQAQRVVPALLADIRSKARQVLRTAQVQAEADWRFVVEHTSSELRHQKEAVERTFAENTSLAVQTVSDARERSQALVREITGQGPQKTLGRGFALVRDANGQAVTSANTTTTELVIQFRDGERPARFSVDPHTATTQKATAPEQVPPLVLTQAPTQTEIFTQHTP